MAEVVIAWDGVPGLADGAGGHRVTVIDVAPPRARTITAGVLKLIRTWVPHAGRSREFPGRPRARRRSCRRFIRAAPAAQPVRPVGHHPIEGE